MAIPGTNLDSAPCVAYVRQDWLDKTGLTVDEDGDHCLTLEELELIGKTFWNRIRENREIRWEWRLCRT